MLFSNLFAVLSVFILLSYPGGTKGQSFTRCPSLASCAASSAQYPVCSIQFIQYDSYCHMKAYHCNKGEETPQLLKVGKCN